MTAAERHEGRGLFDEGKCHADRSHGSVIEHEERLVDRHSA